MELIEVRVSPDTMVIKKILEELLKCSIRLHIIDPCSPVLSRLLHIAGA